MGGLGDELSKIVPQVFVNCPWWVQPLCEKASLFFLILSLSASYLPWVLHDGSSQCPPIAVSFTRAPRLPTICYFSESYWEARDKFIRASKAANVSLHSLEVVPGGYFMDIAIMKGKGKGLLVHTSGVHGVEGYAGSAIQVSLLHKMKAQKVKPTVVFVHAVNPFGMAHFRRWNENNVDLNRNALTAKGFVEVKARDPNIASYQDISDYINPKKPASILQAYFTMFFNMAYLIPNVGYDNLKKALVTGTYTEPKGIFYGGDKLERSHVLLEQFLRDQGLLSRSPVTWLDVHTGLGAKLEMNLLVDTKETVSKIKGDFPGQDLQSLDGKQTPEELSEETTHVTAGYELARGHMASYYQPLFTNSTVPPLVMAQEFGTRPDVLVARAMILENAAYHYAPDTQHHWSKYMLDAFHVRSHDWMVNVAEKGNLVFQQALKRSAGSA